MMYRRPKTRCLVALYEEGVKAAERDETCPYEPAKDHGDVTRSWLWRHGFEDALDRAVVHQLV